MYLQAYWIALKERKIVKEKQWNLMSSFCGVMQVQEPAYLGDVDKFQVYTDF